MGKVTVLSAAAAVVLFIFFTGSQTAVMEENSEAVSPLQTIQHINHTMAENNIRTSRWHIYSRHEGTETMSHAEMDLFTEAYMNGLDMFTWSKVGQDHENVVWEGKRTDIHSTVTERLVLSSIRVAKDEYRAYHAYDASMLPSTSDEKSAFSLLFETGTSPEWMKHSEYFVRAEGNGKGNGSAAETWGLEIADTFSAKIIEHLTEPSFVSLSANTPLWDNGIETGGETMNLQIALRATQDGLGGKTTVTIGTPIITAEY
ncbi:YwmB family TATA-box binding protein [Alteribacter natronophilus]|uniref:YwmB family TATA-box binding protein n=1 Tax=Alteribacter natronophilus TaxID=2583810 RepID=UPI001486EB78|nr:YwmB family TATA-box binding protein [Alteribacter natronophilus]